VEKNWNFPSDNEADVRIASFLSPKTFFLGDGLIFEAAEIVGDMKFLDPFETDGDRGLAAIGFELGWSLSFSFCSWSLLNEFLFANSGKITKTQPSTY